MPRSLAAPLNRACRTLVRDSLRSMPDHQLLARFAAGDETAFAALVERHGSLVRAVCKRRLRDPHLVEDAFQATFVALARLARSARGSEALAGWLFVVARRMAGKVERREERQRRRERAAARQRVEATEPQPWDDLLEILDEELQRLPQRWRAPLVCCYLQGRTQDEAARELGWPLISLRRRLAAAREKLRRRLERRGATLSAGLIAAALVPTADAAVSPVLRDSTAALAQAALANGTTPAPIAELLRGTLSSMLGRTRLWLAPVIAASVLVGAGAIWPLLPKPQAATPPTPEQPARPQAARDRFNDPLPEGAVARLGTIAFKHRGEVASLAFHPNGKSVFSIGRGSISEWQIADGHELLHFGDGINDYDRHHFVAAAARKLIEVKTPSAQVRGKPAEPATICTVWDLATRKIANQFEIAIDANKKSGNSLHFCLSPSGRLLVGSDIGHIWIWDTETGALKHQILEEKLTVTATAFTPDENRLITGDNEHTIRVWNLGVGGKKQFGGDGEQVAEISVAADGKRIAVRSGKYQINGNTGWFEASPLVRLWNLDSGKEITAIDTSKELTAVDHVGLMPDGSLIAVGHKRSDYLSTVCHYQGPDGKKVSDWSCAMPNINSAALSRDGRTLALGTYSGNLRVFDTGTGKEIGPSDVHHDMIWFLEYSADGQQIISAGDIELRRWDPQTGRSLSVTRPPLLFPEHGSVAAGGRFILKAHYDGKKHIMRFWDMAKKTHRDVGAYAGAFGGAALSPDGRRFVVNIFTPTDQSLQLHDSATGDQLWEQKLSRDIIGVPQFDRDGKLVLLNAQPLKGFDVTTGKEVLHWDLFKKGILPRDATTNCMLEQSPDGKLFAFGIQGYGIVIADAATGKMMRRIETPGEVPWPLKFSPDGKLIATSNAWNDSAIRIWDVGTGEKRREFTGARNRVLEFAFSPDGRHLASGGYDGTILVWDLGAK
jgi:RNA polymerase sigma factor (sigma-70 family)